MARCMDAAESRETPFHLRGNFAPVEQEVTETDLPVEGAIPPEIRGLYVRNGPNPKSGTSIHWFLGDGMIHGIRLEGGRASWYRNRWVRTRAFEDAGAAFLREDGTIDLTVALANTNIVCHAGNLLALVENALPTRLTPDLETVGPYDFDGRLDTPMTAHPKICPVTGEMHFFGYSFFEPYLVYHRTDASGRLVQREEIAVRGPTMMHDFNLTERHVIFMDLPVVFDLEWAVAGNRFPYHWSHDYGARLGVMPRGGSAAEIRWFEIEPCYVFHPLNAHDAGDRIVIDVARYPVLWDPEPTTFEAAQLHRWTIDFAAGRVGEQALDDRNVEFPRVDDRVVGRRHRVGWTVENLADFGERAMQLVKYDLDSGRSERHHFGPGRMPSEGVFVPAGPTAGEDEGWVVQYVYDHARDGSDFVILDAGNLSKKPVATVRLPQRVPFGFHGNWVPDLP
jgi:carotenoid cleavage dioxygenase-like enzyme